MFRRDMLGNCLALMVKWSIEAARPIYHATTMHGTMHGTAIYNDTTMHGTASLNSQHIMTPQTPNGCSFIFFALIGKKSVFFFTFFKQSLTLLLLQFWMLTNLFCCSHPVRVVAAESMGKFCGEVVNLSDKKPCTERERSRWFYNSS